MGWGYLPTSSAGTFSKGSDRRKQCLRGTCLLCQTGCAREVPFFFLPTNSNTSNPPFLHSTQYVSQRRALRRDEQQKFVPSAVEGVRKRNIPMGPATFHTEARIGTSIWAKDVVPIRPVLPHQVRYVLPLLDRPSTVGCAGGRGRAAVAWPRCLSYLGFKACRGMMAPYDREGVPPYGTFPCLLLAPHWTKEAFFFLVLYFFAAAFSLSLSVCVYMGATATKRTLSSFAGVVGVRLFWWDGMRMYKTSREGRLPSFFPRGPSSLLILKDWIALFAGGTEKTSVPVCQVTYRSVYTSILFYPFLYRGYNFVSYLVHILSITNIPLVIISYWYFPSSYKYSRLDDCVHLLQL